MASCAAFIVFGIEATMIIANNSRIDEADFDFGTFLVESLQKYPRKEAMAHLLYAKST